MKKEHEILPLLGEAQKNTHILVYLLILYLLEIYCGKTQKRWQVEEARKRDEARQRERERKTKP